jgi:hypothetical protein
MRVGGHKELHGKSSKRKKFLVYISIAETLLKPPKLGNDDIKA